MSDIAVDHSVSFNNAPTSHRRGLDEHRSPQDAIHALQALTTGEKSALLKIAKAYARARKTRYEHEDLLHEAIARVLEGKRKWPTSVPFVAFLAGAMRGIAWDWRRDVAEQELDDTAEPQDLLAVDENSAVARLDAEKLIALFDDDHVAQALVIGMMEGGRGEALYDLIGLSKTEYESKRKKIRRRVERFWI